MHRRRETGQVADIEKYAVHVRWYEIQFTVAFSATSKSQNRQTPRAAFEWQQREPAQIGELVDLREAVPDQTQTKIEAIMDSRQYNHIRVLNLSDICQTSLSGLVQALNARSGNTGDSVFTSPLRAEELDRRLNPRCGAVVAAWSYESAAAFTDCGRAA